MVTNDVPFPSFDIKRLQLDALVNKRKLKPKYQNDRTDLSVQKNLEQELISIISPRKTDDIEEVEVEEEVDAEEEEEEEEEEEVEVEEEVEEDVEEEVEDDVEEEKEKEDEKDIIVEKATLPKQPSLPSEQTNYFDYVNEPEPDDDVDEKEDILWSLKKLQKYHRLKDMPHYNKFTPVDDLKKLLKDVKRETLLDESVSRTKQYMHVFWIATEYVCTNHLSINLTGFANHEMQNIKEYEKIFVEMNEKSYLNWAKSIPPELQLAVLFFTNVAIYAFGRRGVEPHSGGMRGPSRLDF